MGGNTYPEVSHVIYYYGVNVLQDEFVSQIECQHKSGNERETKKEEQYLKISTIKSRSDYVVR